MAEEATNTPQASSGSPMKLVMAMIIGAVLLVAVSMGGVFFLVKSLGMGGSGGHAEPQGKNAEGPAIYFPLDPAFVVNFKERGRTRFLQVEIQVMSRDPEALKELTNHAPIIRNNLLLLFSSQEAETLYTSEGKEKMRTAALSEINRLIEEETGKANALEALYFTSFVTQ
ncbi:MAG: flagellar basal body-associated FliL family protein [Gammaproteobacteria bacterium]|nr:flagellar basal body-associated FliL family protein [Gammaproteobacteria bacterium]